MKKYSAEVVALMQNHYATLNEKQKRSYATLESIKFAYGGQSYISKLLDISRSTIHHCQKTLAESLSDKSSHIRKPGRGLKKRGKYC